jgi:phosphoribosylamine--glycine ligase
VIGASVDLVKILVLGSGAREHALLRALSSDPAVSALVCAPGNAGTAALAENRPVVVDDGAAVVALAREVGADLVVVGPEVPLVAGVADALRTAGICCFGPSAQAAQIEGSKGFAKSVMRAAGVATAAAEVFDDADTCAAHLAQAPPPYVVKADGLAAGKGVHVGSDLSDAQDFARDVLAAPGSAAVVEAFLDGPEVSLFARGDGTTVVPLLPAQDFKRVGDGDEGPNTGGMGAYAPLPWLPDGTVEQVQREVLQPVVDEMARRGTPFSGLLYAGLAMTSSGPQVIEFNCRFGDPETQVVLALLETPLAGVLHACATGDLASVGPLRWRDGAAVTVVVAARGYPAAPVTGDAVEVGSLPAGVDVLHAGTRQDGGTIVSAGGRVLSVTAAADTLAAARELAYEGVAAVELRGAHWRTDIARAAVDGLISCRMAAMTALPVRIDGWTVDDLQELPEDFHHYELVDGALLVSPHPTVRHDDVASSLGYLLHSVLAPQWKAVVATGVRFDDRNYRVPDLVVLSREALDRPLALPEDVLLVVEVMSPGSISNDRVAKPALYARAGIPHYWRIELTEPVLITHELDGDVYRESARLTDEVEVAEPVALRFSLAALVG